MACIRRRRGKWQVQIRRAGQGATSKTFTVRKDALEWARDAERQADRGELPKDAKVLRKLSLGELVRRYRDTVSIHKAGYENECIVFNAFLKHPICAKTLAELRTEDFAAYRDERLKTVKPATLKRQLNPIHHAFEVARDEWGLPIRSNPLRKLKLKLGRARERRLRPGEQERLIAATAKCRNKLIRPIILFALATAMRRGEILAMTWTDFDLRWRLLLIPESKNGESRTIPLSRLAISVLDELSNGKGRVFPISANSFKLAWKGDDPRYSIPLSFELRCADILAPLVQCFRDRAIASEGSRLRPTSTAKLEDSFDLLLANLVNAYRTSPRCFLGVSLSRNDYTINRYRKRAVGYENVIRALDHLIRSDTPFLSYVNGFNDSRTGIGRTSRIKATGHLRSIFRRYELLARMPPVRLKTLFDNLDHHPIDRKIKLPASWINSDRPVEVIRLKNQRRKLIDYKETNETQNMRIRLTEWNTFLVENHRVDLLKSDDDIEKLFRVGEFDEDSDAAAFFGDEPDRPQYVQFERTPLHRVFNNSSFEEGGRFYGGWWQRIPSDARRYITINDKPTREFDYSNLHAAMLYAMKGLPLLEDAYSLEGVDQKYRKLIKATFFRLVNAKPDQRVQRPREKSLPPGYTWKELQEAIKDKHAPISDYLGAGEGLRLQKIDSEIAEDVMHAMMTKDYLALPIHDSFIVYSGLGELIRKEMQRAYRKQMKEKIEIDADQTFLELELVKSPVKEGDEVPSSLEEVELRSEEQGYEGYRERRDRFFENRNEQWHWRFGAGRGF